MFVGKRVYFIMKNYIAMNRFKIAIGREADFENIWENRETYLDDVDGFQKFNLLKAKPIMITPYILLTVPGIQNQILKIGNDLKHLERHIVVEENIRAYI